MARFHAVDGQNGVRRADDSERTDEHGFVPADRTGSHLKLRYEHPETDEVRIVTVPMKSRDDIPTGTLRSIAEQCGANDFEAWCRWIAENA